MKDFERLQLAHATRNAGEGEFVVMEIEFAQKGQFAEGAWQRGELVVRQIQVFQISPVIDHRNQLGNGVVAQV